MTRSVALIVAAGRGHRVGGPLPKQYRALAGHAILHHTVAALAAHPEVERVRVVIHPDDHALYDAALADLAPEAQAKLIAPAHGGATRQDSVRLGLDSLRDLAPDLVLIHDGARPFVSPAIITRTIHALDGHAGAIAAVPVSDTLKCQAAGAKEIARTVDRTGLWRAQTPQTFRYADIRAAHEQAAGQALTDDAAVAEAAGLAVALVEGAEDNLKITTEEDFARAERHIAARSAESASAWRVRVGTGFDVHRFGPGDHLMLCGVVVPFERGVRSHSDGDVGLHAVVDAMLGAMGAGDIGMHFPPSDPAWRNADSALFVHRALEFLVERGGRLDHVDVTLICERPKIGPHRAAMLDRLSELLGLAPSAISLKATTTEGLGFTGRREGIAAQAVATLRLPAGDDDGE